jgi:hypothetical protein
MHSRIFSSVLSQSLRAGLLGFSLSGGLVAREDLNYQPMSGACFLHDSGLEYIPSRLLGIEDVVMETDRGDSDSWTCTDPVADCALEAEKYQRRQATVEQWNRGFSMAHSLRTWSSESFLDGMVRTLKQWNASVVAMGCAWGQAMSTAQSMDSDCPWDRSEITSNNDNLFAVEELAPEEFVAEQSPSASDASDEQACFPRANVFVFTIGVGDFQVPSSSEHNRMAAVPTTTAPSPSDRVMDAWSKTTFARDYCVFAPYALGDTDIVGEKFGTESSQSAVSIEVWQLQQRAAVELQRSVSRVLARNLSILGSSMLRWSEELNRSVRIAESLDASRTEDVK